MKEKCKDLTVSLNRIKGQLNGVEKMLDEKRDSADVIIQISAIKAALSTLALEILKSESSKCFSDTSDLATQKLNFENLAKIFLKLS